MKNFLKPFISILHPNPNVTPPNLNLATTSKP